MKKAAWLLPELLEGSGGHRTIIVHIQYLIEKGYDCDIYVEDRGLVRNSDELKMLAEKYFGKCDGRFILGYDLEKGYDVIFATAWYTAKIAKDYSGVCKKIYFVQDDESLFQPRGEKWLKAYASYSFGLYPITIGHWLSDKLQNEFFVPSHCFDFCADSFVYKDLHYDRKNAICFIYQPEKPRRCSSLGIEALAIVKEIMPEVKIYLYGSDHKGKVPFVHKNFGILPIEKCNRLYNHCSAGLCISMSNPSRIPFEMMAAGLPVVDLYLENNLYDMPNQGVSLAYYSSEAIAQALMDILNDPTKAKNMSSAGQEYMKNRTIQYGLEQFFLAVEEILGEKHTTTNKYERLYTLSPVIATDEVSRRAKMMQTVNHGKGKKSFISKLKENPYIYHNKIVRKLYYELCNG